MRDTGLGPGDHVRHRDQVEVLEPGLHAGRNGGRGGFRKVLRRTREPGHPRTARHGLDERRTDSGRPREPAGHRIRPADGGRQPAEHALRGRSFLRSRDRVLVERARHASVPTVATAGARPQERPGAGDEHPARNAAGALGPVLLDRRLGTRVLGAPHRGPRSRRSRGLLPRLPHPDATESRGKGGRRGVHQCRRRKPRPLRRKGVRVGRAAPRGGRRGEGGVRLRLGHLPRHLSEPVGRHQRSSPRGRTGGLLPRCPRTRTARGASSSRPTRRTCSGWRATASAPTASSCASR